MVKVAAEGEGVELIDEFLAGRDHARPRHAVHPPGMDAVEVDRMRMTAAVLEHEPEPFALDAAERRPRHPAVIGPGRKHHARGDLDLALDRGDDPFPHRTSVSVGRKAAVVEIGQDGSRVEPVRNVVHGSNDPVVAGRIPLGTVPAMLGIGLGGRLLAPRLRRVLAPLAGVLLLGFALLTIGRGLGVLQGHAAHGEHDRRHHQLEHADRDGGAE